MVSLIKLESVNLFTVTAGLEGPAAAGVSGFDDPVGLAGREAGAGAAREDYRQQLIGGPGTGGGGRPVATVSTESVQLVVAVA